MSTPVENPPRLPEDGIGERIRQARELKGLSQVKLAELTKSRDIEGRGIPRSVLLGYESGKYKPGARELRILCSALELDVKTLLFGSSKDAEDDLARAEAVLLSGALSAMPAALNISLSLMRLKDHEREAFATLVRGMVLKTFKRSEDSELLGHLADLLAIDLNYRLSDALKMRNARDFVQRALAGSKGLDDLVGAMERIVDAIPSDDPT